VLYNQIPKTKKTHKKEKNETQYNPSKPTMGTSKITEQKEDVRKVTKHRTLTTQHININSTQQGGRC